MTKQILYIALTLLFTSAAGSTRAQETPETTHTNKVKWGLQVTGGGDGLSQSAYNDLIYTYRQSVILLGAFAQYKKAELNINAGFPYLGAKLSYKVYENIAVTAEAGKGRHRLDIERYGNNFGYDYSTGDINVTQYKLGVGYHNTFWQRLKLEVNAKAGGVHTDKGTATDAPEGYAYYSPCSDYSDGRNKRSLKTDTYKLSPSFIFGGDIYLELLPQASKKRKSPLVPFCELSIMGNSTSYTKREVIVEEWIPGNIVYRETSDGQDMKYDLGSIQAQFGVKWYLKY